MSTSAGPRAAHPPAILRELLDRFDPHVIDVPGGRARIRLEVTDGDSWDVLVRGVHAWLEPPLEDAAPDALLSADTATWERVASDLRGGMDAFRRGRLRVRSNLHLGVGLLAATSGITEPGRLRFESVRSPVGRLSTMQAGTGEPLLAIHGLGGTKASFLPTIAALADSHLVIAVDLPGSGESEKPIAAPYNAAWFAGALTGLLDELGIERAHLVGNSMGGRVAIELGLTAPERTERIVLLSPALAWLRDRAAFYAAARNVYLDEPHGEDGFWTRLAALSPDAMFIWGRQDALVPISFMRHVERVLPAARHVELDCGHVPQLERARETHAAIRDFLAN